MKIAALLLAGFLALASSVFSQTTVFTYQGQLRASGNAANGFYDLQFNLFATSSGGTALT